MIQGMSLQPRALKKGMELVRGKKP